MKIILDTNIFYHFSNIEKKEYVNNDEFIKIIQSSDELGLSILSLYEFLIKYKKRFDFVKDKLNFVKENKINIYGYPREDIEFTYDMLNDIMEKKSNVEFDSLVKLVIRKRVQIEISHMYEYLKLILRRYEESLIHYYEYERKIDRSLINNENEIDPYLIALSEPWLKISLNMYQQFRINFLKAATQPLMDSYLKVIEYNQKGNMESFCKNTFDYCLGLYAVEIHEKFQAFLVDTDNAKCIKKRDSGESDKYIKAIRNNTYK